MIDRRSLMLLGAGFVLTPRAMAFEESFFESAGVRIRYTEEGRGHPIILVHGYTSDTEAQFIQPGVIPALAQRYRTIGMDARGHGRSGKPHDPAQYGPKMAMDVARLLDHLGLQRAHILGYSMGAHIVAQLLTQRPERFLTVTLAGAAGRLNWSLADQQRVDVEAAEMDQGLLTSQIVRLWPLNQPPPTEEQLREISARQLAGKDPRALAAVRRSNPAQVVTVAQLAASTVPMLGIVGTADPYLADFERLKVAKPNLKLVTIQGASHGTAPSRPEFPAAVLEFLSAHPV
jgi:pimeloyl-ACP methyl ester carboxylesterase